MIYGGSFLEDSLKYRRLAGEDRTSSSETPRVLLSFLLLLLLLPLLLRLLLLPLFLPLPFLLVLFRSAVSHGSRGSARGRFFFPTDVPT